MAEAATKLPVKTEVKNPASATSGGWYTLDRLRQEVDRLFDNFPSAMTRPTFRSPLFDVAPMWRTEWSVGSFPAVDIVEKDNAYELSAELPGMDEKNIDVKYSDGMLTIKGEKEETKEESKKDYHLSERSYGSFQRSFSLPDGIDTDKIEATFKKGVLTVSLPKSAEAKKKEKEIAVAAK